MVLIGVDDGAVEGARFDDEGVALLVNASAAAADFGMQGLNPFTFLDAETSEFGKADGMRRERGEDDGGHDAVAEIGLAGDDGR
jgi:hypothetical protein